MGFLSLLAGRSNCGSSGPNRRPVWVPSRCVPIAASWGIGSVRDSRCTSWPLKPSDFGGKNQRITLEQAAEATNALAWTI